MPPHTHSSKLVIDEFMFVYSPSWQMLEESYYCFHLHSLFANRNQHLFVFLKVELEFMKKMFKYIYILKSEC